MKPNSFAPLIYIIFELEFVGDFVGKGGPNLLEPYGRHDLSDFGVHPIPIVLDVFLFLRFPEVFSCDFRFASYTLPFHEIPFGSFNP